MKVYIARQAILDRDLHVFGYELLFRSTEDNRFDSSLDGDLATRRLVAASFVTLELDALAGGKKAFINFPEQLLLDGTASLLPPGATAIEVVETVQPSPRVIAACDKLRAGGYLVALDDLSGDTPLDLLAHADIGKVDFRRTKPFDRMFLARKMKKCNVRPLAEKVETRQEFEEAISLGYQLFQGYFFEKPVMMEGRDLSPSKRACLRILEEVHRPLIEYTNLENLIKEDVSLTYKLLRYINSAFFQVASPIESIRQALLMLGDEGVRRWVTLVTIPELAKGKPGELALLSIFRAKLCEDLAVQAKLEELRVDAFLVGMFSLLDALLDCPREKALVSIHLSEAARKTLLSENPQGPLPALLALTIALEKGDWNAVWEKSATLGLTHEETAETHASALKWADSVMRFAARTI